MGHLWEARRFCFSHRREALPRLAGLCRGHDSSAPKHSGQRRNPETTQSPCGKPRPRQIGHAWPHGHDPNRSERSTRLNSSHLGISYAVFCLKKKKRYITKHETIENNAADNILKI